MAEKKISAEEYKAILASSEKESDIIKDDDLKEVKGRTRKTHRDIAPPTTAFSNEMPPVSEVYENLKTYELQRYLFSLNKGSERVVKLSNEVGNQLQEIVEAANKIGSSLYRNKASINGFINNILCDFLSKYQNQIEEIIYKSKNIDKDI